MHPQLRNALEVNAFVAVVALICVAIPVPAHGVDCAGRTGIELARCERCQAEVSAFKTCEPQAGRDFMRCVRDEVKASPIGVP